MGNAPAKGGYVTGGTDEEWDRLMCESLGDTHFVRSVHGNANLHVHVARRGVSPLVWAVFWLGWFYCLSLVLNR